MSARSLRSRSLQMFASHVPAESCVRAKRGKTPGPTRSALGNGNCDMVISVPQVTVLTVLDRFIIGIKHGRPDPFHRSPKTDYFHGSSDREPTFEEREPEDC